MTATIARTSSVAAASARNCPRRRRPRSATRWPARAAEIFAPAELRSATVPAHEVDELMLLSSWFRRFPAELDRTVAAAAFPRMRTA